MLETINDPGLTGERLKEELDRAEAVVDLSQALVSTYRVVIDAQRNMNGGTLHTLPAILGSPMSRKLFTDEQLLFLKNNAEGMTSHELTAAYNLQFGENRSRHTIRSTLSHNGWIGKLRPAGSILMPSSATCMQIEINPIRSWWSPSIIVSAITELPTESRTLWSGADGVLTMQAEKRQRKTRRR